MDNFEQRMFIGYLDKLLPCADLNCYNFQNVFEFMVDEFKLDRTKFKFDKYGNPKTETTKQENAFVNELKKQLKQYSKTLKPKNTLLEKLVNIIVNG